MSVRVRFAPSPTGHVHIGNIRAAIFNWLFARHEGGSFLLRVEDTDLERSTAEAKRTLFDVMEWLGLDHDEAVLYQSTRRAAHTAAAEGLESEDEAYRLSRNADEEPALFFRIPYGLEATTFVRDAGTGTVEPHPDGTVRVDRTGVHYSGTSKKGKPIPVDACLAGYHGLKVYGPGDACLFDLDASLDAVLSGEGEFSHEGPCRLEYRRREVVFTDLVKGELAKPLEDMKDLVIVRSNGSPVFHLANVCDDIEQKVTHIIRGDDHVENTYRHLLLYHALGAEPPRYAHLPMIVNAQGKPYSKRDGDAYVGDFRDKGFEAAALFNYLSLLGWSPGDDKEKMTREEAVGLFTLDRIKSGPAQMDIRKLTHLNAEYVAELPLDTFVGKALEAAHGMAWGGDLVDDDYFRAICALLQSRTHVYSMVADWGYFYSETLDYDEKAVRKQLRKDGIRAALEALRERLASVEFADAAVEQAMHDVEQGAGLSEGKLNQPTRVAVTGTAVGAGIYETIVLLGRERMLDRLDFAIANLCE